MLVILSVVNEWFTLTGQKLFGMLFKIDNFSGFGSHYDRIIPSGGPCTSFREMEALASRNASFRSFLSLNCTI
jgi:hypothetical protein